MPTKLVITVVSPDRKGIVQSLAKTLADNQGEWLESKLANLAGKFVGVIVVRVDEQARTPLIQALKHLDEDLHITVDDEKEPSKNESQNVFAHLHLLGQDRPGIVQELSEAFVVQAINVEEVNTQITSEAYTGNPLFEMNGTLSIPPGDGLNELRERMDLISDRLAVDISIETMCDRDDLGATN